MAVELKYTLCENSYADAINFRELTEDYSASNIGGWGAPNEIVGDAVLATLLFKSPGGVVYPSVDLFVLGYPTVNEFDQEKILASTVDSSLTIFEDGFWTITYSVTTGTTTYKQTKTFFFYANIAKRVCELVSDLKPNDCECDPDKVNRVLQMNAFLCALQYSIQIGDLNSANEIFSLLENLIECSIC